MALRARLLALLALTVASTPLSPGVDAASPLVDRAQAAGIHFRHERGASEKKHLVETMGSGCALLDYDRDGWLDVLIVNGGVTPDSPAGSAPNHALYRNLGDGTFENVTARSGIRSNGSYGMGVAVGDYDNDGYPDIYITAYGSNTLFRNNRDGTFTDVTREAGVSGGGWSTSACFADFDRDGYLDLFVTRYLDYGYENEPVCMEKEVRSYCHPRHFRAVSNLLYRSLGGGRFEDVSGTAGIATLLGKGLGIVAADFDGDGWTDVYIANDGVRNFLLRNKRNGTFSDVTLLSGTGYNSEGVAEAGMGTDTGDFDGDGRLDLFVTNYDLETNALYRNEGRFLFTDERWRAGVARPSIGLLGFGTGFFDFDNDGDQDLLVINGHVLDTIERIRDNLKYAEPAQLFENLGGRFREHAAFQSYAAVTPRVGRGAAFGDVDNDGRMDVLVSNSGQEAALLINQSGRKNWLVLELVGTRSSRDAVGAEVRVVAEGRTQVTQVRGGRSYLSASDLRVHFGLGDASRIDLLKIRWPSGAEEVFDNVEVNQFLAVIEGTGQLKPRRAPERGDGKERYGR